MLVGHCLAQYSENGPPAPPLIEDGLPVPVPWSEVLPVDYARVRTIH